MLERGEPAREQESTYLVQDRSNQDEMTRLEIQDKMFTAGMGPKNIRQAGELADGILPAYWPATKWGRCAHCLMKEPQAHIVQHIVHSSHHPF